MNQEPAPNWQPISMLSTIATLIDGELANAEEHYTNLRQVRDRPHILDDVTVNRSIKLHTEQQDFLWVFQEQLDRWRRTQPSDRERQEIDRLSTQLDRLSKTLLDILTLAEELSHGTIDKVLAKSDLEVGIEALQRLMHKPR